MVATVVLCVMLLSAWAYKISRVDHCPAGVVKTPIDKCRTTPAVIGRITGMKDCEWSDKNTPTILGAYILFDRKYALSAGLLEITYTSGARIIIEGPCEYTVNSYIGGFLQQGRLVARVEKKAAGAKPQAAISQSQTSSLSTPHSPLFAISTPTAVVTDLGTEFGVEVCENGDVVAHVLEGQVEFKVLGDGDRKEEVYHLDAGKSARLAKIEEGQPTEVVFGEAERSAFPIQPGTLAEHVKDRQEPPVRRWLSYSKNLRKDPSLVAYYTFETPGRASSDMGMVLPNVSSAGESLDGRVDGPRWVREGRFPGKWALRFTGSNWQDRVELPKPERFNFDGPFSIAVWVPGRAVNHGASSVDYKGGLRVAIATVQEF